MWERVTTSQQESIFMDVYDLFYEDRTGFIGIIFCFVFCSCVWKGSIRDETHLELKILMRLETSL